MFGGPKPDLKDQNDNTPKHSEFLKERKNSIDEIDASSSEDNFAEPSVTATIK